MMLTSKRNLPCPDSGRTHPPSARMRHATWPLLVAGALWLCAGPALAQGAETSAQPGAQPAEIPLEPLPGVPRPPAVAQKPKKKRGGPKTKTTPAPWLSRKQKGKASSAPPATRTPGSPESETAPLVAAPPAAASGPSAADAEPPPPLVMPGPDVPARAPASRAALPQADAPPLLQLSNVVGVVVLSGQPAAAAARIELGLRAIAELAPLSARSIVLTHPQGACEDEACLAELGAKAQIDQVLAASFTKAGLRVRAVDVATRARLGEEEAQGVPADLLEQTALSEALACKVLVPAGCMGEFSVAADSAETKLEVDGAALPRATQRKLPVGLHALKARLGTRTAERQLPVLRDPSPGPSLTARLSGQELRLLSPAELREKAVPVAALIGEPGKAAQKSSAPRIAGIAALSAGAVVGVIAAIEGAHSKTQISQAEDAYHQHGGAYYQSDLAALQSGNSAARSANLLFAASFLLAASGLVLTLAF